MSKSGRPRRDGARTPSGQLSRAANDRGTPEAQLHRLTLAGSGDPVLATYPLGTLLANGTISDEQWRAGCWYAWLYSVVIGQHSVAAEAYRRHEAGLGKGREDWLADRQTAFRDLQRVFRSRHDRDLIENLAVFGRMPRWARPVVSTVADLQEARRTLRLLDQLAA